MKLDPAKAAAAFDRPDPAIRLFLLSGNDNSASRLMAKRLQDSLKAEKIMVSGAQLKADPNWLAEEAATISMFGGARLLWIEPGGEDIVPAVEALLTASAVEAPAVAITNSALKKDSGLKKLADAHPLALHLENREMTARQQVGRVTEIARAEGLRIDPATAERLVEEANGDLILARLELQKFALYLDAAPDRLRDLDQTAIEALGIDQSETDQSRPGDLALAGDLSALAEELRLLEASGIEPIPVVRALQRRLIMLAPLCARVEQGQSVGQVMQQVWRDKDVLSRIIGRWTPGRLSEAFIRVQGLERDLLLSPTPGQAALGELLLQLARAARR